MWFTGTDTGKKYNVGQAYTMAGATYVAQADGSFKKEGTNHYTQGSKDNPNVQWGGTGPGLGTVNGGTGIGGTATQGQSKPAGKKPGTNGPGVPGVVAAEDGTNFITVKGGKVGGLGNADPGSGPGVGGVVLKPKDNKGYTQLYIMGMPMPANKGFSDGADFEDRWGEWGGAIAGIGVFAADVGATVVELGQYAWNQIGAIPVHDGPEEFWPKPK